MYIHQSMDLKLTNMHPFETPDFLREKYRDFLKGGEDYAFSYENRKTGYVLRVCSSELKQQNIRELPFKINIYAKHDLRTDSLINSRD